MGYTNETTHYGIPLPLGSDLTTPMDYNTAAEAIDSAVFEAVSNSSGAVDTAAEAVQTANAANTTAAGAVTEAQTAHAVADSATTAAATAQTTANAAQVTAADAKTIADNLASQTQVIAQVTGDGVKTVSQILNELYIAAKPSLVANEKVLVDIAEEYMLGSYSATSGSIRATNASLALDDSFAFIDVFKLSTTGSYRKRTMLTYSTNDITFADLSAGAAPSGVVYKLVEFN